MIRILNAACRAVMVLVVIAAPAFLLPGSSRTGQEISLIMGGLLGVFTLFEYASRQPGLIDFRFAPPYNRARFFTFATIIFILVFVCRAHEGVDEFGPEFLVFLDQLVAVLDFPLSPLTLAVELVAGEGDPAFIALVSRAGAAGLSVAVLSTIFFTLVIWVLRWPAQRESFNLWINLPTFDPSLGKDVSWRLRRGGLINVMIGLALPYAIIAVVSQTGGWFDSRALANYQPLIWGCVLWNFVPWVIFMRGQAMLKIAWLIDKARTD
ncbi:MAG: hypothetical protein AAGJ96_01960 [Pseudomonadota bacterium]